MTSETESTSQSDYSDADLLSMVETLAIDGIGPTLQEFNDEYNHSPAGSLLVSRFGSWNDAVREAGLSPTYGGTKEDIIQQMKALADGDSPPSVNEFTSHPRTVSRSTLRDKFGKYNNLVEAAGLTPRTNTRPKEITKQDVIDQLQELAGDDDVAPKSTEFVDHPDTVSETTVRNLFGGYVAAVKAAGLEPHRDVTVTKEDVIADIQDMAEDGDPPRANEFNQNPDTISSTPAINLFGSWNAAVDAAMGELSSEGQSTDVEDDIDDNITSSESEEDVAMDNPSSSSDGADDTSSDKSQADTSAKDGENEDEGGDDSDVDDESDSDEWFDSSLSGEVDSTHRVE